MSCKATLLFLAQQPATQPLGAIGNENLDAHFLATNAHTQAAYRHTLYFQTTVVSEREVRCASLWGMLARCSMGPLWFLHTQRSHCPSCLHGRWTELCAKFFVKHMGQSVRPPCLLNALFTSAPHSRCAPGWAREHSTPCITAQTWAQIKNQCLIPPSASGLLILAPVGTVAIAACVTYSQVVSCVEPEKLTAEVWMRY